ncbi:hypothetical protein ACFLZW_01175 [Chloroflexota bacterium]
MASWAKFTQYTQSKWRWLGYALSGVALVYLVFLLIQGGVQLQSVDWIAYALVVIYVLGIYLISMMVQAFIWVRMISFYQPTSWRDIAIYARSILMRRMPGGIWHWVGRSTFYANETQASNKAVALANILEMLMLLLVAGAIIIAGFTQTPWALHYILPVIIISLATIVGTLWQPKKRHLWQRITESLGWISLYSFAWLLGGWIIFLFVETGGGQIQLNLVRATWIWAITGGSTLFLVFIPAGVGIREVTLGYLLGPYTSVTDILVIVILLRISFTLADILWGGAGWLLSASFTKGKNKAPSNNLPPPPKDRYIEYCTQVLSARRWSEPYLHRQLHPPLP